MSKEEDLLKEVSIATEKAEKAKAKLFDMYVSICAEIESNKKYIEHSELQKKNIMRILEMEDN